MLVRMRNARKGKTKPTSISFAGAIAEIKPDAIARTMRMAFARNANRMQRARMMQRLLLVLRPV